MNNKQAHEIAKQAAVYAYKLTLKKLAQVEQGEGGLPVSVETDFTVNPQGYAGSVANTGGNNVTPGANKAYKDRFYDTPEEAAAGAEWEKAFELVNKRKPTDEEKLEAIYEMRKGASSKAAMLKTAERYKKFLGKK